MNFKPAAAAAILLALCASGPAAAGEESSASGYAADVYADNLDYDYDKPDGGSQAAVKSAAESARKTLRGIIRAVERLTLRNPEGRVETHWVAKVQLQDGRQALADLGEAGQKSMFIPSRGMHVELRGRTGRINGRRILFAQTATHAGRVFQIRRHEEG